MYDMSRSISKGYADSYTDEQRHKIIDYLSEQRWTDAKNGKYDVALHEIPFDDKGNLIIIKSGLPDQLPPDSNPVLAAFYDYYKTPRGFHERSVNSNQAWTKTNGFSLMNIPILAYIKEISPRPVLLIAGENAHSRYFSEDTYKMAAEPKELMIIPNAVHVDLYDRIEVIPFDKLENFFRTNLK
jgi:fermentation-respiration switch protein FrsA (DUF1100 family)